MSDANKAVFLSYASQDADAAKKICDALRATGVVLWFDQSELVGGDAWDQKIRKQIKDCALLIPIISAATQARTEGYFRLEWRLADQRTHLMAKGRPFLLPVVIDDTRDADAHVPDSFTEVQWTRLLAGETPPVFAERVKKLLGGEVAPVSDRRSVSEETIGAGHRPALPRKPKLVWLWVVLATICVAMALLLVTKEGRKEASPTAPASEVRQLIEQAQALVNKAGAARAELEAAEELCKKAAKLDPTDAELLATWSQVCIWLVFHGFDPSPERREEARFKAAQAFQLASGSYEARLAQACYLVRGGGVGTIAPEGDQADGLLQSLLREKPDEPRALLALGVRQGRSGHFVEARATLGRLAENPGFAATAWGELGWSEMCAANYAEAEAAVDRANALQPLWRNLILKLLLAVEWRGDLDLASVTQERLPESVQQEDVGIFTATYLCYLRHEPEQMLRTLDADPRDWFYTGGYIGPKAVWAALAHEQLGAKDRAMAQWQLALKSIERSLDERPDRNIQLLEAYVLAALGRDADAEKTLGLVVEASRFEPLPWLRRDRYVVTQLRLGHPEAALDYLEKDPRLTAAVLQHEPRLDPLRGLSRFQALREKIEADPSRSPTAKATAPVGTVAIVPAEDEKSIAVLAFANLSDDKANEYFSDGISEELLNVLAKVPGLKVTARTSSFYFKGKEVPIPEIAQKLGVAYVLEGSVRKSGDKVRITAQLIKAADGFQVWSDQFDRELKDIFAVQDEIAGLIAKNLSLKLGAATVKHEVNPQAYALFLRARQEWNARTLAGFARAESALKDALELEPDFAAALALRATLITTRDGSIPPFEAAGKLRPQLEEATGWAERAVKLDPESAETHVALGAMLWITWQYPVAERELRRAIAISPSHARAHAVLGRVLEVEGRLEEGIASMQRAVELDPLAWRAFDNLALMMGHAGRLTEAMAAADRSLALQPDNQQDLAYKASLLMDAGRGEEAAPVVARMLAIENDPVLTQGVLGYECQLLVGLGKVAEAKAFYRGISDDYPVEKIFSSLALGQRDEALARLNSLWLPATWADEILWNQQFDPVRNSAEFTAFLKRIGLTEAHARAQAWRAAHPREKLGAKL